LKKLGIALNHISKFQTLLSRFKFQPIFWTKKLHSSFESAYQELISEKKENPDAKMIFEKMKSNGVTTVTESDVSLHLKNFLKNDFADKLCPCGENLESGDLINCTKCQRWYHVDCVGQLDTDIFVCEECSTKLEEDNDESDEIDIDQTLKNPQQINLTYLIDAGFFKLPAKVRLKVNPSLTATVESANLVRAQNKKYNSIRQWGVKSGYITTQSMLRTFEYCTDESKNEQKTTGSN